MSTHPGKSPSHLSIALGSDHGGFELKERLKAYLQSQGYTVVDVGTHSTESVDYPVFAARVAQKVASGQCQRGIMVDGAGIGSCMAANKVPGIRAAMCYDISTARNSREHNDANVLTLGGGLIGFQLARQIVDEWLSRECTEERHRRRVNLIHQIEKGLLPISALPSPSPPPSQAAPRNAQEKMKQTEAIENTGVDVSATLSEKDLEIIAEQISAILQQRGLPSGSAMPACTCCGGHCGGLCAEKSTDTVRQFLDIGAQRISYTEGGHGVPKDIAKYIDHTLLRPDATSKDVEKLCQEALQFGFASVCVNPTFVRLAADLLRGSSVKVCSVVGFPLGTHVPEIKALEARRAIRDGAREIDMVINIGALKDRDLKLLYRDIRSVVEACDDGGAICKVIIETALLSDEEKIIACETAKRARAEFVKTSTGFGPGGATAHDVALMAEVVRGSGMGVKASGGIRSYADALQMIKAGATRIGASASVQIVKGTAEVTESNY
ncbi:MAG: deoxyribose-phosphate aldolase [Calditrichaeota bacterium]|nr:MAG: deoxyribose-phosphate aldolase [Calditrichota bacterium]